MTWSRRDFLGTSALGLLAGAFPRLASASVLVRSPLMEVRRNVGIFTGRGGTIGWLANPAGAAVVDSQYPATAQEVVAGLEARGAAALDALINTHHHGDHTGGNGVFRGRAQRIVAQARVPELQRRAAEASDSPDPQTYADTTFEQEWSLAIGDETVRAKYYGPAHTSGDSTVFFERADVVHMGDLVFNRAYPFVDRRTGASIENWIRVLESVAAEHGADTIYVFGHAAPASAITGSRADLMKQRDFFTAVLETVRRAMADGKSREQATALAALPGFEEYVAPADWLTLQSVLGAAWDELSA